MTTVYEKPKLSNRYVEMKVCDISIIGHPDTGAFIGLDNEGETLIQMLKEGVEFSKDDLTENQLMLLNALDESGFFAEQPIERRLQSAFLHVTSRCNLDCIGCYSYENERNMKADLSLDEIKKILDNLVSSGLSKLTISGGEPFMRNDIIDILRYAKEDLGIEDVTCISNGFAEVSTYLEAGQYVDLLKFSLDACDDSSATIRPNSIFNPIITAITVLKDAGINVAITFTIHKKNFDKLGELPDLVNRLGVSCNLSVLTIPSTNGKKSAFTFDDDDFNLMYEHAKNNSFDIPIEDNVIDSGLSCSLLCGAGTSTVSISSVGDVYPCHFFNGYTEFFMGNSLENDIVGIVNSEANIFASMTVDDLEQCKGCDVRYFCGGGCRFRGYADFGDTKGHDRICKTNLATIENIIRSLSKN